MSPRITGGILLLLVLLSAVIGAVAYPALPDQIASHWNAAGEADGAMPKFWGVFLFPALMGVLLIAYVAIPKIDPLRANIESFRTYYDKLWVAMFLFFFYIFGLMLAWNFGYRFNFTALMIPAMAFLWYSLGVLLEKSRRNWFVGIRTPWTLSSDAVWEKTHTLGGKLFRVAAMLGLAGFFFRDPNYAIALVAIPAAAIAAITIVYSYAAYRREETGRTIYHNAHE